MERGISSKPASDTQRAKSTYTLDMLTGDCANAYRQKKSEKNTFDLLTTIHESEYTNKKPGLEPAHRFEVTLEPDTFSEEKFALFDNYQRHVHHEGDADISRRGFQRFLCASPLHRHTVGDKQVGSYHQTYRLDGRLVAMAVLDLLPQAVSGVYFIYHSDFEKWSFGKLSALREAALAIECNYIYYYMGYYIHSCAKMRYKGDYKPYVLDYETMQWDALDDEMRSLMDKRPWVSMARERKIREAVLQIQQGEVSNDDSQSNEVKEQALEEKMYGVTMAGPVEAAMSGLSVLQLEMPGPMSLEQIQAKVDLDKLKVAITRGSLHEAEDLIGWDTGSETNMGSLKGVFTELTACVGPDVAREIVVDLSRGG